MRDYSREIAEEMQKAGLPAQCSYAKTPPQLPCVTLMLQEVKPRFLLDRGLFETEDLYEMTVWAETREEGCTLLRSAFRVLAECGLNKFGWNIGFHEAAQAYRIHCYASFQERF